MSKIKLESNPSGTGTFTIQSPASSTDRTLTLPDEGGEVLLNGTSSNVGIGTSTINDRLVVASNSAAEGITLRGDGYDAFKINMVNPSVSNDVNLNVAISNALLFSTNNTERMRINSVGRVKINSTSSYSANFEVRQTHGSGNWDTRTILVEHNDGSGYGSPGISFHAPQNSSAGILKFWGAGNAFEFRNSTDSAFSNVGANAFITASDYRLKENIVPLEGAIDRLKQIKVHRFNFIDKPDATVDGYLAHELAEVIPEAVTGEKDATYISNDIVEEAVLDDDGNVITPEVRQAVEKPAYQGVDQAKVTPLLVAALQEALTEIDSLKARIEALESN